MILLTYHCSSLGSFINYNSKTHKCIPIEYQSSEYRAFRFCLGGGGGGDTRYKAKKKLLCCPLPTDRKMRKNRVGFFFFFLCQIWAKNLLKFVFNGFKKHLHDLYMRFDCIPPEFSPFRNLKKNIGKLNSLTVRKKKKKKVYKIMHIRAVAAEPGGPGGPVAHPLFFFFLLVTTEVGHCRRTIPTCIN